MMAREDLILMEEMNLNAWPALKTVHLDGWLLRSAGGETRRPNSVNIFAPGTRPLVEKIEATEAIYRRWGRPCIFRMTPLVDAAIEPILDERGYQREGSTFVQIAMARDIAMPTGVEIFEQAADAWIEAALMVRGLKGTEAQIFAAQHRAIGVAAAWALIREGGEALACGCSSYERGQSGLTGIYVHKDARRRGLARAITEALLSWGKSRGARQTWLQVDQTNRAALPLYASLGFHTAYEYYYRVRQ